MRWTRRRAPIRQESQALKLSWLNIGITTTIIITIIIGGGAITTTTIIITTIGVITTTTIITIIIPIDAARIAHRGTIDTGWSYSRE